MDSSRSHCIMTVYIESRSDPLVESSICGKVSFVDLAGSERLKSTRNSAQSSIKETGSINRSLFTLGQVISTLGDIAIGKQPPNTYIPYRNSSVTKLLKDSLGGNGLTIMIACISPARRFLEVTLNTLYYATRARNIENKPAVKMNETERVIESLREDIRNLRLENQKLREASVTQVQKQTQPTFPNRQILANRELSHRHHSPPDTSEAGSDQAALAHSERLSRKLEHLER
eukprot:810503_1